MFVKKYGKSINYHVNGGVFMKVLIFLAAWSTHHIIGGQPEGKYLGRENSVRCLSNLNWMIH